METNLTKQPKPTKPSKPTRLTNPSTLSSQDSDVAIKVEKVSKKFSKDLKHMMLYGIQDITKNILGIEADTERLRRGEFWAVDDVSFELNKGDSLGIIGPNGSGKTTILKMLNGIFMPDKGRVETKGRAGALIAIGAGFHPMLTGRENIYVNGAVLGMSKREIDRRFDPIVRFADIGDFLDSPIKYYSAGMYVRLGFAIAIHCEPDILLVDEILAVGDRNFQTKCYRKMHELKKKEGVSIVMVSHNEHTIREYTQRCLVLNNGKILFSGKSEDAISFYVNRLIREKEKFSHIKGGIFDKGIIKKVIFKNAEGNQIKSIPTGEKIIIDFDYETERRIKNPIFGITFLKDRREFAGLWNSYANVKLPDMSGKGRVRVIVENFDLPVGSYSCYVVLCEEEESNVIEWKDLEQELIVESSKDTRGLLKLKQTWEVISQ